MAVPRTLLVHRSVGSRIPGLRLVRIALLNVETLQRKIALYTASKLNGPLLLHVALLCVVVLQREIALYTASKLNEPLINFKPDTDLQPYFKEAWCKKLPPTLLFPGYTPQPMLPAGSLLRRRKDQASGTPSALRQRLLDAADRLGRRTQYSCPGFLPNARQVCPLLAWYTSGRGFLLLEIMQRVSA